MNTFNYLLSLFVYTICCSSQNYPNGIAVILDDAANTYGAVCIDGTSPYYYYANGTETTKYIVYFQGGGWCSGNSNEYSTWFDSCFERRKNTYGSSASYTDTKQFADLMYWQLDRDSTNNPLMHNWTMIYLPYCDGASFGGNRENPDNVTVNGEQALLYSRGHRIMKAVFEDLLTNRGMTDATDIVISGCSAGGLATWLHSDWIKDNLLDGVVSSDCRISALPDSGFFLHYNGTTNYSNAMKWVFDNGNMSYGSINVDCINYYGGKDSDQAYKCIFAQNIAPFVDINLFALNSQYDWWQVAAILGATESDTILVNDYGQHFTELMYGQFFNGNNPTNNYNRAGFIDSCYRHCIYLTDGGLLETGPFVDGKNQATGHMEYYMNKVVGRDAETYVYFQNTTYKCDSCCSNDCIGCSAGGSTGIGSSAGCYNMITETIYACPGTFTGGVNSTKARHLCNEDEGYYLCELASQTKALGLTSDLCQSSILHPNKFYATLQSSDGHFVCNIDGGGWNDVWGCAANGTCDVPDYGPCNDSLASVVADLSSFDMSWANGAITFKPNGTIIKELYTMSCLDSSYCGVMCCKENIIVSDMPDNEQESKSTINKINLVRNVIGIIMLLFFGI